MKRFTDTNEWFDPWYRKLSPKAKHLKKFLWDHCDCAGVVGVDLESVTFHVGELIEEKHLTELGSWLNKLPNGQYVIPSFINFQCGELSATCPAHKPVIKAVASHGLVRNGSFYFHNTIDYPIDYPQDNNSLLNRLLEKEKEKVQVHLVQEGGVQGGKPSGIGDKYHKDSRTALHLLNEGSGKHFRETDSNLAFISARLSEQGVTIDGVRQMIARQCQRWNGTKDAEYLRPETLFNKTKFDGYYAAKDQPIIHETSAKPKEPTLIDKELLRMQQQTERVIKSLNL
jgi:uncharacterized phage protein (TIGR02220 family)